MTAPSEFPVVVVQWNRAARIVRSLFPPISLFEDIADPADWALIMSAEQKTNPRLVEGIGALDMVPPERRVGGPGASYLMAPFTHASRDRPSRFSDGTFGLLYVGSSYEVALFETIHHHARFMAATQEAPGWTSQFREIPPRRGRSTSRRGRSCELSGAARSERLVGRAGARRPAAGRRIRGHPLSERPLSGRGLRGAYVSGPRLPPGPGATPRLSLERTSGRLRP